MTITKFEDVVAWQEGRLLNKELFNSFKEIRNFSFRDQLFRASLSITNNIAEGFERGGDKEFRHFLIIARGSTAEVRSMLFVALDSQYISRSEFELLMRQAQKVGMLITGFVKWLSTPGLSDNKKNQTIRR